MKTGQDLSASTRNEASPRTRGSGPVRPGAGDEIHVVAPTWQPLLLAAGLTMALAGTIVFTPILLMIGLAVAISAIGNWIALIRKDFHHKNSSDSAIGFP